MPHPDSTRLHEGTRVQGGRTFVPPRLSSARLAVAPIGVGLSKRESTTLSRVWIADTLTASTRESWLGSWRESPRESLQPALDACNREYHAEIYIKNTVLWYIIRHIWGWMCMYIVAVYNLAGI